MSIRSACKRPAVLALQGATLVALVAGASAWSMTGKTLTVSVDGVPRAVGTHGSSVRDVLLAAHLTAGPHDLLAPALGTKVKDGGKVVLRRGRQVTVDIDGTPRTAWVTATSVAEALDQIGVRAQGAVLSADRSRAIPLRGFTFDVRLPKAVQLRVRGHLQRVTTTDRTVGEALRHAGVQLGPGDRVSVAPGSVVRQGEVVTVTQLAGRHVLVSSRTPFPTVQHADSSLYTGQTRVAELGHQGVLQQSFLELYTNGRLTTRRLESSRQTVAPRARVIGVGTRSRPAPVVARRSAVASSGGSTSSSSSGLNWAALANCESGGNPRSVSGNGSYRGLYQFSFGTWQSVGGSGDPIDASASEQTYRARLLYQREGRSPWPICGKYL